MKDKNVAGILAILIGAFGVHQFYLGNTGKGILYAIFFWTGIPVIVGVIDGVLLLTREQHLFDDQYNGGRTSTSVFSSVNPSSVNASDELEKLHNLKEKGIISEEDFLIKKRQIIGN